jgi:rhamnose utilization protein RhaD (predicted bifunctional aldolase and dehydrogenase)/NAD(P)-dependent dehydrogenase (short-subunit alcohol dehydrogenase family)
MESRWNDAEAASFPGPLGPRIYTSRLLGRDPSLVLHGGGNTSVKLREPNVFGDPEDILYVKGSGGDLATIDAAGFAPVRLEHLRRLAELPALSDTRMARELRAATIDPDAPTPSVEAILHAILPYEYVDHTHADAFIAVCNTPGGAERVADLYSVDCVVVPYVMPGFKLARACAELFAARAGPATIGMALVHHGLFSFGATARESYERMIALTSRAEAYLQRHNAWRITVPDLPAPTESQRLALAALRREVSAAAGAPMLLTADGSARALAFARRPDLADVALRGPASPDHVIRTKLLPLLGRDVAGYAAAYRAYFERNASHAAPGLTMLDPAPRVILDPALGLLTAGRSARDAAIAADMYRHTMDIIERAVLLGGYRALPEADLFAVEYWELEQAKLKRAPAPGPLAGEVALVTGAASGIGRATAEALLRRGAAVVALDINEAVETLFPRPAALGLRCDVTDERQASDALEVGVRAFGGVDILVLNAGIFPASRRIADLPLDEWERTLRVNLDANLLLLRATHPLLRLAPRGGRVVVIGSKNVPAPGPGAAAYSASKAALTQLARVAALEWATDGIRVNVLHPNAVFDTGLWTEELLASRAASYGLTVEEYKRNNLLRVEVTSHDVAELAAEMAGPLFAKTTGAQIPVDGGNERVV